MTHTDVSTKATNAAGQPRRPGPGGLARGGLVLLLLPLLVGARFRITPCCTVIGVDTVKGIATIRDNKTGRTWQFEAGVATLNALKVGAEVEADLPGGKTLSIAGVQKAYALNEPDPGTPCCTITQIHLAALDGGIVVRDRATGATHHVTVENQAVLAALKVRQDVAMDADGKWALIRTDMDGKPATFSFPVSAGAKPADPCCGVILVDAESGIVTIRDRKTGLTTQFEAGAQAIRMMKEGDDVITGAGPGAPGTHILSVGGVARTYTIHDPARGAPCCTVSVINGGVTTVDKATGATRHVAIDNPAIKAAIKVGQNVSMDASGKWALFQLELDGKPATYSFPIEGTGKKSNPAADTAWEIKPNSELTGPLGRLVFSFTDKDAVGGATIRPVGQTDEGQFVFFSAQVALPPGKYDILASGVPVKNVPIETGMETVVKVGLLKVTSGVAAGIYDQTKTKELLFVDGGKTLLPVGSYYLKVNGAFTQIVIRDKQVTEF